MAETSFKRLNAVVTGGNKGIRFEICRQLASNGVLVVLTARDESRGLQALERLKNGDPSLADYIIFHQLDVADSCSISSLTNFVTTQFGKLDILVNNAGILVDIIDVDAIRAAAGVDKHQGLEVISGAYKLAEECLKANYYGPKQMMETFLPLLQQSDSPTIICCPCMHVLRHMSKAALNAYSRMIDAKKKKYPNLCINCVCPGYVKTDINANTGTSTAGEGAAGPVKLALLPDGGPSGRFFHQTEEGSF
ncbi:unnamed protein product [Linum trigynum]|uniref:(+)-neomenthol dehydrogenase-like n=1 Tax=Linum trigynum TaxID=586398 RepID=A0AAV2FTT6_9ROSI